MGAFGSQELLVSVEMHRHPRKRASPPPSQHAQWKQETALARQGAPTNAGASLMKLIWVAVPAASCEKPAGSSDWGWEVYPSSLLTWEAGPAPKVPIQASSPSSEKRVRHLCRVFISLRCPWPGLKSPRVARVSRTGIGQRKKGCWVFTYKNLTQNGSRLKHKELKLWNS